jgi:hypothetical protein
LFEINWNEKNDSEKCFRFLSKWCKTKKLGGTKCKKHKNICENFKIPWGAAPPHIHSTATARYNRRNGRPPMDKILVKPCLFTSKPNSIE